METGSGLFTGGGQGGNGVKGETGSGLFTEAIKAGFYEIEYGKFPKVQILTIEELFAGKRPHLPWLEQKTFRRARREIADTQGKLI